MMCCSSKFRVPRSSFRGSPDEKQAGFTLLEVILVMVLMAIISGIMVPSFSGTLRGSKLRSAARTIERMSRYGHSMAIMREETLTMVLNHETMELFLGGGKSDSSTNAANGELGQEVLKRLDYVDGKTKSQDAGIEKEIRRTLPDGLHVRDFKKAWTDEDGQYEDLYLIHFYPNGQCDGFELELEDKRGLGIKMENDPISGKIWSEFLQ